MIDMIDIHSHILYDIPGDDGSQSEVMTWEMIDQALQAGIRHIICTPHVNKRGQVPDWDLIQERIADLNQSLEEKGPPLQLHSGGEIRLDESVGDLLECANRFEPVIVSKIAESLPDSPYTLANSRYILLELGHGISYQAVDSLLYDLILQGYYPILAHPERYLQLMKEPKVLQAWLEQGVYLQCNIGSFLGAFGAEVKMNVDFLYDHGAISFLGTDAHDSRHRTPDIREAQAAIVKRPGGTAFWQVCQDNASYILRNERLPYRDFQSLERKKKKWWIL